MASSATLLAQNVNLAQTTFVAALDYLYSGFVDTTQLQTIFELLFVANAWLLDEMKRRIESLLLGFVDKDNALALFDAAVDCNCSVAFKETLTTFSCASIRFVWRPTFFLLTSTMCVAVRTNFAVLAADCGNEERLAAAVKVRLESGIDESFGASSRNADADADTDACAPLSDQHESDDRTRARRERATRRRLLRARDAELPRLRPAVWLRSGDVARQRPAACGAFCLLCRSRRSRRSPRSPRQHLLAQWASKRGDADAPLCKPVATGRLGHRFQVTLPHVNTVVRVVRAFPTSKLAQQNAMLSAYHEVHS